MLPISITLATPTNPGFKSTFAHADCQRKNIIIRKVSPPEDVINADQVLEDDFEVTIIDWEKAGWYPSSWEYCLAIYALRWDDDWCLRIQNFLPPSYAEAPWLQMLRFELWSDSAVWRSHRHI